MNAELTTRMTQTFDGIRHIDEYGREYWRARELSPVLEYADYRNFLDVVERAKLACTQSGYVIADHFGDVTEMVTIGSGGQREIADIRLSRYACYLIVQNGDPTKPVIANGQTYFAIQTRRQELADEEEMLDALNEEQLRLILRTQLKEHNKRLVDVAHQAGVITGAEYAIFQNYGYMGLYGGLDARGIHAHKGLKPSQKILDHMGSTELAANLFRATQTEDKLRRDNIRGKMQANRTHLEVGKKVRQTIQELGGEMPENLPVPDDSIQELEKKTRTAFLKKKES